MVSIDGLKKWKRFVTMILSLEINQLNRFISISVIPKVVQIFNKCFFFSFDFLWMKHAPGVPKVLVGNRLHLAFKRQVAAKQAELYASRNKMACFEISPLCDFNIRESFCELARMALHRNGMERIWRSNKGNPEIPMSNSINHMDMNHIDWLNFLFAFFCMSFYSTFTARAVLSSDCATNIRVCNWSIAIAAIRKI